MNFPLEDEPQVGNTEKLQEQEHVYQAGDNKGSTTNEDETTGDAVGGSDGTVDGQ